MSELKIKSLNSSILFQLHKSWKNFAVPSSGKYDLSLGLGFLINFSIPVSKVLTQSIKTPFKRIAPSSL